LAVCDLHSLLNVTRKVDEEEEEEEEEEG